MKKLISLLATIAIFASVSSGVFATAPANANPQAVATVEPTGDSDPDAGTLYLLTINLSNLGTLTHVKNGTKYGGDKFFGLDIKVIGDGLTLDTAAGVLEPGLGSTSEVAEAEAGYDGIEIIYARSTARDSYPTSAPSESNVSIEGAVELTFYAQPGTQIRLADGIINYVQYSSDTGKAITNSPENKNITFATSVFTLPGDTQELGLEVTGAGANNGVFANGYVWNATITPGEGELTSFAIKFVDSAENELNKTINNIEALNAWAGLGTSAFQIGLKTTRTLASARFTVTDNAEGSDVANWAATN